MEWDPLAQAAMQQFFEHALQIHSEKVILSELLPEGWHERTLWRQVWPDWRLLHFSCSTLVHLMAPQVLMFVQKTQCHNKCHLWWQWTMIAEIMVLYFPAINAENKQNCKCCNLVWILTTQLCTNTRTHHTHWHYNALLSHISRTIHWSCWLTTFMFLSRIKKKLHLHPDKPVSWSFTLQGILMIRIFITIDYILWDYVFGEHLDLNV